MMEGGLDTASSEGIMMATGSVASLALLFEDDETGWLEQMASLIGQRRYDELDYESLETYLTDMARRDKREVLSRLTVLIAHRLKWDHQPDRRSTSWRVTIAEQRRELEGLFESDTLLNYAREVLPKAYRDAVELAAIETGMEETAFPSEDSRTVEEWLSKVE
jgi:hypothetical protein